MHVRFLHVCPWFDSSSFIHGPIVFFYLPNKGHLGCFQVLSIENDHPISLYHFWQQSMCQKELERKIIFLLFVSEGSAHHGGEGWQGSMSQHGSPESDQRKCWSFAEPHTLSSATPMHFLPWDSASSLLLLPLGLCFSLLLLARTCSLLCPLDVFVPSWSSPFATQAFCCHPWNRTDLIAVFSPLRSISCLVHLFYFWWCLSLRLDFVLVLILFFLVSRVCLLARVVHLLYRRQRAFILTSYSRFFSLLHFTTWVSNSFKVQAGS